MIRDHAVTFMEEDHSMKIMENIEPREVEPGVPEWAGDPGIQVIVIPGRGIIGDNRRAFSIVIIIDHGRCRVLRSCRGRSIRVSILYFSDDR
jgi:hypothetical protein